MKKSIVISVIVATSVLANTVIPLSTNLLSTENGGTQLAIDAYSDGVGIYSVSRTDTNINNSALNNLVFKYGTDAKTSGENLRAFVLNNTSNTTDINLATQLGTSAATTPTFQNGTDCDDNNPNTINDMYLNNVCSGIQAYTIGTTCTDGNTNTYNDKYIDIYGTCKGITYTVGAACNDGNPNTVNDKIDTIGYCKGVMPYSACDDGISYTAGDNYNLEGICETGWIDRWHHLNPDFIISDFISEYNERVSYGINVELTSCSNGESYPQYITNPFSQAHECMLNPF